MEIVALQEIRWMGTGTLKMNDGNIFYGDCGNTHELRTGFYVNNSVLNSVKDFQSINNRISKRCVEYFDELLNAEEPQHKRECCSPSKVDIHVATPTLEEIQETICKLKSNKVCGEDQIYADLIKKRGK